MKHLQYLFSFLIWGYSIISQEINAQSNCDTLKKYSYSIYGDLKSGNDHYQSTGAFIKWERKLFLITAKHVLNGCRHSREMPIEYPSQMKIFLHNELGDSTGFYSIKIGNFRDTGICPLPEFWKDVDILQVSDSLEKKVFLINHLFTKDILPKFKKEIVVYGFPVINNMQNGKYNHSSASILRFEKFKMYEDAVYNNEKGEFKADSNNYYIEVKDIQPHVNLQGYSGSPVFVRGPNTFYFLGVLSAVKPQQHMLIVSKYKNVLNFFEKINLKE